MRGELACCWEVLCVCVVGSGVVEGGERWPRRGWGRGLRERKVEQAWRTVEQRN